MVRPCILHIEMFGHPSWNYPLTRMAECGFYFAVHEFAAHVDLVTCPACRVRLAAREAMTFAP